MQPCLTSKAICALFWLPSEVIGVDQPERECCSFAAADAIWLSFMSKAALGHVQIWELHLAMKFIQLYVQGVRYVARIYRAKWATALLLLEGQFWLSSMQQQGLCDWLQNMLALLALRNFSQGCLKTQFPAQTQVLLPWQAHKQRRL